MLKIDNLANNYEAAKQAVLHCFKGLIAYLGVKIYLLSVFILNISTWLFARHIYLNIGQERMALHYSVDFGIDFYGQSGNIFIIPLLGLVFIVLNLFLLILITIYNKRDSRFLFHLTLSTALVSNAALLVAIFTIYLINFR